MDEITRDLAAYVEGLDAGSLTEVTLHEAKKRIIDTLACAVGAYDSETVQISRRVASFYAGASAQASIFVTGERTSIDMAAFVNTAMVRYLDYNDTYIGPIDGGHPSDCIPAVLAASEARGCNGMESLLAIVTAYEGFCRFIAAMPLREQGWDHGLFVSLGTAMGAGKIFRLPQQQLAEAAGLAVSPNVPTRQTRSGALSLWKGTATAAASRAGVFAALLAEAGMTGPTSPFLGKHGIVPNLSAKPCAIAYGGVGRPFAVELATIKNAPVEFHLQAPVQCAVAIGKQFAPEDLQTLEIDTYSFAYTETAAEAEKWRPNSRETADHSMPYVVARALVDGKVTAESFGKQHIADPCLHIVMDRITVRHDPALTARYPSQTPCRMRATLTNGNVLEEAIEFSKGHERNPMKDADVEQKFFELCLPVLGEDRARRLLALLWRFEELPSLKSVLSELRYPDAVGLRRTSGLKV